MGRTGTRTAETDREISRQVFLAASYRHCWNREEVVEWRRVENSLLVVCIRALLRCVQDDPVQRVQQLRLDRSQRLYVAIFQSGEGSCN